MLTIIAYKTNPHFLAYHLFDQRVVEVKPGDNLASVIESGALGRQGSEILFQINLSNYQGFFADTTDPHKLLEQSGYRVVNSGLYDISKSRLQERLRGLGLASLSIEPTGFNSHERVMIKSDLNYGGLFERGLSPSQLTRLGIDYDLEQVPANDEYRHTSLQEVSDDQWQHPGIHIERFIENKQGSYTRVYKLYDRYVFSKAIMPGVEIKKINHRKHETHCFASSDNLDALENEEYKGALRTAAALLEGHNIDFATVDMIRDDQGVDHIIDVNHTPFWGKTKRHHFIEFLAVNNQAQAESS